MSGSPVYAKSEWPLGVCCGAREHMRLQHTFHVVVQSHGTRHEHKFHALKWPSNTGSRLSHRFVILRRAI